MQMQVRGIDVSWHRGIVDWPAVRASGITFAFVKATEGTTFLDSMFYRNWSQLRKARILRGAYHFFRPAIDPVAQAHHYINRLEGVTYEFDLPPVLDVENSPVFVRDEFFRFSLAERQMRVMRWLDTVEQAMGRTPIIYTNPDTWLTSLGNSVQFSRFPLWIANYGVSAPNVPANNWGGRGWTLWQFTDRAAIPGVNGGQPPTDHNHYRGSLVEFYSWVGVAGLPELPPAITYGQLRGALTQVANKHGVGLGELLSGLNLTQVQLPHLNDQPYDGLPFPLQDIPEPYLSSLMTFVDLAIAGDGHEGGGYPLFEMSNQQVINGFYQAAEKLGLGGWQLLSSAGLTGLASNRQSLYSGPRLHEIPQLDQARLSALEAEFGLKNNEQGEGAAGDSIYPGVTNQMVINAVYKLAAIRGTAGWGLLQQLGFQFLVEKRAEPYAGPKLQAWKGVSPSEQAMLAAWLNISGMDAPYPGLLNQDVINLFYRAAAKLGVSGWGLLVKADLHSLASSPEMRNRVYVGNRIEDLSNLNAVERQALLQLL